MIFIHKMEAIRDDRPSLSTIIIIMHVLIIKLLSRYLISRCDTYHDTSATMRYVSRYLLIALVNAKISNLSMMVMQYTGCIGLGTLYSVVTIGAECAGR